MNRSDAPGPTFGDGIACFFGGIRFVATTPAVWPLAAVPTLVGGAVSVILAFLAVPRVRPAIVAWLGPNPGWLASIGAGVLTIIGIVLAIALALILGFSLAQPLSGPALERIVRQREAELGLPPRAPTGLVTDVLRSLQSLLVGWMVGLPPLIALVVAAWIIPGGTVLLFPLKLVVACIVVAWDVCDYPMSVGGMAVGKRLSVLADHRGAVLGFSLGLALAGLVPFLALVLLPTAVAGATQLMHLIHAGRQAPSLAE
jgi:CysZ protein